MSYQIMFANTADEKILGEILIDTDMGLAGDIQDHVVIKQDNEILGGGMLAQTGESVFHLLVFAVRQDMRGTGIGSQLLQELIKEPWKYCAEVSEGFDSEYRVTTVAKGKSANFYRKNGFAVCDFSELVYPFSEQCDECPTRVDCKPAAMMFIAHR